MAPSLRRNVASDIRRLLEDQAASYCDACLALRFGISLEDAHAIALMLADAPGFVRRQGKCETCTRTVETTCGEARLRRRS